MRPKRYNGKKRSCSAITLASFLSGSAVSTIATVVGLVGLGTLLDWVARSRRFTRYQSLLRLRYKEPLDLVLCSYVPPSDRRANEAQAVSNYETILATLGTLKTAAVVSQAVTATRNRKEVVVHVSEEATPALEKDLILVGGTLANEISRRFFEYINANCPGANVTLAEDLEEHNVMSAGNVTVEYDWTAVARAKDPSHDFGLVIFWVNPFAKRRRRAILFAGFTSYGAYGAARYVTRDFLFERYTNLRTWRVPLVRERTERKLPPRWRFWRWPSFVLIVEVVMKGGEIIDVRERALHVLNDPKYPLLAPPSSFPGSRLFLGAETRGGNA